MTRSVKTHWTLYVVLVAIGALAIMVHTIVCYPDFAVHVAGVQIGILDDDRLGYVATRDLPANHLIADDDLERPPLPQSVKIEKPEVTGRYTTRAIAAGAVVREEATRAVPRPVVREADRTIVALPLGTAGTRGGAIDAGRLLSVGIGGTRVVVTVLSVSGDTALVSAPIGEAALLTAPRDDKTPLQLLPLGANGGKTMDQKSWSLLGSFPVQPVGAPWVRVLEYVPAGTLLRFEVDATANLQWTYHESPALKCGPDGDAKTKVTADALPLTTAPAGCLLAKVGGSTAANDGTVFAVGSFCVRKLADADSGPLYLGMNVAASNLPAANTAITVKVFEAKP